MPEVCAPGSRRQATFSVRLTVGHSQRMSVLARLRRLDARVDPNLRREHESADEYLMRLAHGFWRGRPARSELQAALREHFALHHDG
jgi:hypothetical protein